VTVRILAIIPARGGSKGLPNKNCRQLCGKSLLQRTFETAQQAKRLERVVLSSEDATIIAHAKSMDCEVPFVRPAELATDTTPGIAPILHAITELPEYDYVVVLQVTTPLRSAADIDHCIQTCIANNSPACVSVTATRFHPNWCYHVDANQHLQPLISESQTAPQAYQRQQLNPTYTLNGAVYVAKTSWLLQHKTFISEQTTAYVMPPERSIDIDSEFDFLLAQTLLTKNNNNSVFSQQSVTPEETS